MTNSKWFENIGHRLIKSYEIRLGDIIIDRGFYDDYGRPVPIPTYMSTTRYIPDTNVDICNKNDTLTVTKKKRKIIDDIDSPDSENNNHHKKIKHSLANLNCLHRCTKRKMIDANQSNCTKAKKIQI